MSTPPLPTAEEGWFPTGKLDLTGWRFDVITLLAVIGEASVAVHAQTLTASTLCLLPRLIPAPQALLKGLRPKRLPEVTAKMAGVYGGTVLDTVGFFANILHPLDELDAFAFQVWEIRHKPPPEVVKGEKGAGWFPLWCRRGKRKEGEVAGEGEEEGVGKGESLAGTPEERTQQQRVSFATPPAAAATPVGNGHPEDLELGLIRPGSSPAPAAEGTAPNGSGTAPARPLGVQASAQEPAAQPGLSPPPAQAGDSQAQDEEEGIRRIKSRAQRQGSKMERVTDVVAGIGGAKELKEDKTKIERYAVPPAFWSPLHVVSVLSCALTVGIFIAAAYWEDGTAMLAIFLLSLASSVTCYASWWRPLLMNRPDNKVPKGDVVIRTRAGAFILIKCREEVVRELYSGTEECKYVSGDLHRIFMGLGMVLLMVAVVLLGNCGWNSQALTGASYIFLNAVYWGLGLLPQRYFWDLSRYTINEITELDARQAHVVPATPTNNVERIPSFTRTLWYAIRETERVAWVERSGAMPMTEAWKKWLDEASAAAREGRRDWPAVASKNRIMQEAEDLDNTQSPPAATTSRSTTGSTSVTRRRPYEEAREVAPAEEVQAPIVAVGRTGTL